MDPRQIANFHQVSSTLYRGAEPTREGIAALAALGVRTVINLEICNLFEGFLARCAGMNYQHIPCKPWHPEDEDVAAFLATVTDPDCQPVFVHCRQGADRTGMMVAAYRIVVQGWTKADAIIEMAYGGFGFHGSIWPEIVPYLQAMNLTHFQAESRQNMTQLNSSLQNLPQSITLTIDKAISLAPADLQPVIVEGVNAGITWAKDELQAWVLLAKSNPDAAEAQLVTKMNDAARAAEVQAAGAADDAVTAANTAAVAKWQSIGKEALSVVATILASTVLV